MVGVVLIRVAGFVLIRVVVVFQGVRVSTGSTGSGGFLCQGMYNT